MTKPRALLSYHSQTDLILPDLVSFFSKRKNEDNVEKPAETSIRLASHLVRAPNSRSGGHELET